MNAIDIPLIEIYSDVDFNCRGKIAPIDVISLARDIERDGLQNPISVQEFTKVTGKKYRIVSGHRRFEAIKVLHRDKPTETKWATIPAFIRDNLSEIDARRINLNENLERADLNPVQIAKALEPFRKAGYKLQEIADFFRKSIPWISLHLDILKLEPEIQDLVGQDFFTQKQIKDLASMPTKDARFVAVKKLKEKKERGEKNIEFKRPKQNIIGKKRRDLIELNEMKDHLYEQFGPTLSTRVLAWAAGHISTYDLYLDIREEAKKLGKEYSIPVEKGEEFVILNDEN